MEERFHSKHCTIGIRPEIRCVEIVWNGAPSSIEFKNACNMVIDLLAEFKWCKILTDNRKSVVFGISDIEWLNTDWLNRALAAGYKVTASVVDTKQVFVDYAVNNVIKAREQKDVESKRFINYDSAMKWLSEYHPS